MHPSLVRRAKDAVPLHAVAHADLKAWLARRPPRESRWLVNVGVSAKICELALLPSADSWLAAAVLGLGKNDDPLALAAFAESLPPGTYALADVPKNVAGERAALGWILGTYAFERYRKNTRVYPKLVLPEGTDGEDASRIAEGVFLARDLIATPANDMGPEELARAAQSLAKRHGAKLKLTVGDALLKANYPLIHTVGRASARAPRLIDFSWGRAG